MAPAQLDPSSDLLQDAYDRPLTRQATQAVSADRRLNDRKFLRTAFVALLPAKPVRLYGTRPSQLPSPVIDLPTTLTGSGLDNENDGGRPDAYAKGRRVGALLSLTLKPFANPAQRSLFAGVAHGESLYDRSNFRGEFIEPSLPADLGRFEQSPGWQIGGGGLFSYGCHNRSSRFLVHCGPSFKQSREAFEGERCFGVLFRFEIGKRKPTH